MSRYELTLSPNYVEHWGTWEALRELKQNTIDRSLCYPDEIPTMLAPKEIISYDEGERILTIGNRNSELESKTLLLGESGKKDNIKYIGQYGEGYKLALLVLLRTGKKVKIYNKNMLWEPKIINSRKYNSKLLVVDISKLPRNERSSDLKFIIENITRSEYIDFSEKCLDLSCIEKIETSRGDILLDGKYSKKIYVNGLFVCEMNDEKMKYGYSFKPRYIKLDRDRQRVNSSDLFWETSYMWAEITDNFSDNFYNMIKEQNSDLQYLEYHINSMNIHSDLYLEVAKLHYDEFIKKYGKHAVVVNSYEEAEIIKKKYGELVPIVLPKIESYFISNYSEYKETYSDMEKADELMKPLRILEGFRQEFYNLFTDEMEKSFNQIIELAKYWRK